MLQPFVITGNVEFQGDRNLIEGRVEAYDRDLPSLEQRGATPQLLGQSPIDGNFRFRIEFTDEQFRQGEGKTIPFLKRASKIAPDLSFRVFDATGRELTIARIIAREREYRPDQIIFNAPTSLEEIQIIIEPAPAVGDSEYEKWVAALSPVLGDLPIADLTNEDIQFLVNELGLEQLPEEQNQIRWLRYSALLARETNLPIEAFYGWGRRGLPASLAEIANVSLTSLPSVLEKLISLETRELERALLNAIAEKIVPASLGDRTDEIIGQLKRRNQVLREIVARLLESQTGEALVGYTVTTFDVEANNRDLGTDVTNTLGEFVVAYYVDSTALDAEHTLRFRVRGPTIAEAVEVTERVRPDAAAASSIRVPLPEVNLSLKQLREGGRIEVTDEVLEILKQTANIQSFTDIRRRGGLRRIAELRVLDSATIHRLDALADLDRLSSDLNETLMLLDHHYDSVFAIAETPRSEFVLAISANEMRLSDARLTELHAAAKAQTDILNQIFTGIAIDFANGDQPSTRFVAGDYFPPFPEE
jgi:hypothetical protein